MNIGLIVAGVLIVAAIFAAVFVVTVRALGWKEAAIVWGSSAVMTAVMVAGFLLIEAGVKA